MTVVVNGKEQEAPENCNVRQLLELLSNIPQGGLAVAVNNVVSPKSNWESHLLNHGDHLLLIKASQGG